MIHPPVRVEQFRPSGLPPEDFYLLVSGFVPYKRDALAIEAFRALGKPLIVAGSGPLRARLQASAPRNVLFLGRVDDTQLADLYARCRALIYPQEEDFGLIAVEVQAAGRPVIAFGRGGATETVVPLRAAGAAAGAEPAATAGAGTAGAPTGLWFAEPTSESLCDAVREFEKHEGEFSPQAIRQNAQRFAEERFCSEIQRCLASLLAASS